MLMCQLTEHSGNLQSAPYEVASRFERRSMKIRSDIPNDEDNPS